tara:strand:- start:873 stop:1259 length:387 start_codon:yes stop_codon:yes gene_type:complete
MSSREHRGLDLDKDLLVADNKQYSPSTCVLIHGKINTFISTEREGFSPNATGAFLVEASGKYLSTISNPITNLPRFLGTFSTEKEAHEVWREAKHGFACELVNSEYVTDINVSLALMNKYRLSNNKGE